MFARQGLSAAQISLLFVVWSLVGFALEVPTGVLADRFSRRHLLALAQLFRACAFLLWWLAPGFTGFAAGFALWGVEGALTSGAFQALVFDELHARGEDGCYARVMGRGEACSFGGAIVGSLVAAALVPLGFAAILVASAATCIVAAGIVLSFPDATPAGSAVDRGYLVLLREGLREVLARPALLALVAFAGVVVGLGGAIEEFYGLILRGVGLRDVDIGLWHAAFFFVAVLGSLVAHRVARVSWARLAALAGTTGFALLLIGRAGAPVAVLALLLFQGTYSVQYVCLDARLQAMISTRARATVTSVQGLVIEVVAVATYLGVGLLADVSSIETAIAAMGGALVLVAVVFAEVVRRARTTRPAVSS